MSSPADGGRDRSQSASRDGASVAGVVLAVDPDSAEAPFRQLKGQIVDAIRRGALTPGTRLPAVRALAEQAGVAARTAAKVYSELEQVGVLETRGRSGTFIAAADLPSAVLARAAEEFAELASTSGFSVEEATAAVREAFANLP